MIGDGGYRSGGGTHYGGSNLLWSAQEYQPYIDPVERITSYTGTLGLIGAGLYGSTQVSFAGEKVIDHIQRASRKVGYSSPLALLNTFRVAEFLSPFVGPKIKGLTRIDQSLGKNVFGYTFESNVLQNSVTMDYLKKEFGSELQTIAKQDPRFDLLLGRDGVSLRYEVHEGESIGKLFFQTEGKSKLISDKVQLFELTPFDSMNKQFGSRVPRTSAAAFSYLQASGFTEALGPQAKKLVEGFFAFKDTIAGETVEQKSRYFPIKAVSTNKNLTYPRSLAAFGMDRFNRLLETATEQMPIINNFSQKLNTQFGMGLTVQSGPALNMFMRFGLKAAKIGALGLGIKELDYWRGEAGILGNVGVSAITSAGLAYASNKLFDRITPKRATGVGMAAFAAQMILPGFSEGLGPGLYTAYKNLHIATAAVGEVTFMSPYRRTMEGLLPGVSDWKTGALVGLGLALSSGFGYKSASSFLYDRLSVEQKTRLGISADVASNSNVRVLGNVRFYEANLINSMFSRVGLDPQVQSLFGTEASEVFAGSRNEPFLTQRARDIFKSRENLLRNLTEAEFEVIRETVKKPHLINRFNLRKLAYSVAGRIAGAEGIGVMEDELAQKAEQALAVRKSLYHDMNNAMNISFLNRLEDIDRRYFGFTDPISKAKRSIEVASSSLVHSFFGASKQGELFSELASRFGYKSTLGRYGGLFLAGLAVQQVLTGGLLGTMEGPTQLQEQYSGKKLIPVRRGRWWEGGGTPFEGRDILYYRPHNYAIYMSEAVDKARYKKDRSPVTNFLLENFTYTLEKESYYDRPYPITGAAFANIPIIGPLLSSTVGRLIKPPKLMHVNEYMRMNREGEVEFAHRNEYKGPRSELGGLTPGKPMSPFAASFIMGEMHYNFRELEGLTGWAKNMFTLATTGEETFGIQRPVLESAGKMFSAKEDFWKQNLGGGFFTTEPVRRYLPRERSMIDFYNPIVNTMPSWMPDRFKYGDPYRNVEYGEVRLPGSGYAAIHPELKDISFENYPEIYRYSILGDIAPHSREFILLREKLYQKRSEGFVPERQAEYMDEVDRMINEKMSYQSIRDIAENAYEIPVLSDATRSVYGFGQKAIRKGVAPIEYMIPMGFRPAQKLISQRDMIEQYEYERLYGTQFSFWDKPIRDWFRPAFYSAANILGYDGVPGYRQSANEVNEYFDKLEFVKQMKLAELAEMSGDSNLKRQALTAASRTRHGINPQANAMAIYQTLPDGEKAFFDSFTRASIDQRERILEMVPEDMQSLYQSVWKRVDRDDKSLYPGSQTQINDAYMTRQLANLDEYFYNKPMPGTDWVGWQEGVEMDDIKVRYADNTGMDIGDLDMYKRSLRRQSRMPYLTGSEDIGPGSIHSSSIGSTLRSAGRTYTSSNSPSQMEFYRGGNQTNGLFYYNDDKVNEIHQGIMNVEF